mmetsp:Transcript_107762/g.347717  ORF Transcript_107762/g.347717 Transcript_107762/m.347717 type:complete len:86 (+) Transcript_107762:362-619(+)
MRPLQQPSEIASHTSGWFLKKRWGQCLPVRAVAAGSARCWSMYWRRNAPHHRRLALQSCRDSWMACRTARLVEGECLVVVGCALP